MLSSVDHSGRFRLSTVTVSTRISTLVVQGRMVFRSLVLPLCMSMVVRLTVRARGETTPLVVMFRVPNVIT